MKIRKQSEPSRDLSLHHVVQAKIHPTTHTIIKASGCNMAKSDFFHIEYITIAYIVISR